MENIEFNKKIKEEFLQKLGIEISDGQCQSFFDYMNLLIEKNKVMNLTAITESEEIIVRHFVDSCAPLRNFEIDSNDKKMSFEGKKIIDVGTGAGFPGLPLAIMIPDAKFVLTDTLGKRINFLQEVIDAIGIKNVELVKARAEDLAHDSKFREKFDYCMARGVARMSVLAEYSLPFVKIDGFVVAYKMDECNEELNEGEKAIKTLGGMFHVKHSYVLLPDEPKRCLLFIKKVKNTPKTYPRKAGTPTKNPIL